MRGDKAEEEYLNEWALKLKLKGTRVARFGDHEDVTGGQIRTEVERRTLACSVWPLGY